MDIAPSSWKPERSKLGLGAALIVVTVKLYVVKRKRGRNSTADQKDLKDLIDFLTDFLALALFIIKQSSRNIYKNPFFVHSKRRFGR